MSGNGRPGPLVQTILDAALARLQAIEGVRGSLIATRDGSIVVSAVGDFEVAQSLAATTAAICGRLADVSSSLGIGTVVAVLADTESHTLQFMPVGGAVLAVIAERHQNVRAIREAMRALAVELAPLPVLAATGPR